MSTGNTAILFFSRTQHDEFSAKPMGISRNRFHSIYKFFTKKTLNTARNTGLPVIESYSDHQQGRTFNERLTNELQRVANQGFEKVIIIGNDAPSLTCEDLLLANDQLSAGKQVLGKDNRGGVYLIGLNLDNFDCSFFDHVSWNSSLVFGQLNAQLEAVYELTSKTDINHFQDIQELAKRGSALSRGVITFLRSFISSAKLTVYNSSFTEFNVFSLPTYRGPPVLSH